MKTRPFFLAVIMLVQALTARGEGPAAFGRRCIPAPPHGAQSAPWGPRADCVAPPSNIPDILGRHAMSAGRLAALGATPDFHLRSVGRVVTCRRELVVGGQASRRRRAARADPTGHPTAGQ